MPPNTRQPTLPPLPPVPPLPPLPAAAPERWISKNIATLIVGLIGLAGVLGAGFLAYKAGTNTNDALREQETDQFFLQERRQAYADFYGSVMLLESLHFQAMATDDSDIQALIGPLTNATDEVKRNLATVRIMGSDEIVPYATDIATIQDVTSSQQIGRSLGSIGPGVVTWNLELETTDGFNIQDRTIEAQRDVSIGFVNQARTDLNVDDN